MVLLDSSGAVADPDLDRDADVILSKISSVASGAPTVTIGSSSSAVLPLLCLVAVFIAFLGGLLWIVKKKGMLTGE